MSQQIVGTLEAESLMRVRLVRMASALCVVLEERRGVERRASLHFTSCCM